MKSKELKNFEKKRELYLINLVESYTEIRARYPLGSKEFDMMTNLIDKANSDLYALVQKRTPRFSLNYSSIIETIVGAAGTAAVTGMIMRHEREGYLLPSWSRDITGGMFKKTMR